MSGFADMPIRGGAIAQLVYPSSNCRDTWVERQRADHVQMLDMDDSWTNCDLSNINLRVKIYLEVVE